MFKAACCTCGSAMTAVALGCISCHRCPSLSRYPNAGASHTRLMQKARYDASQTRSFPCGDEARNKFGNVIVLVVS